VSIEINGKIISVGEKYTNAGIVYKVICFDNIEEIDNEKFPETIVYKNIENGRIHSGPVSDWFRSMKKVEDDG